MLILKGLKVIGPGAGSEPAASRRLPGFVNFEVSNQKVKRYE